MKKVIIVLLSVLLAACMDSKMDDEPIAIVSGVAEFCVDEGCNEKKRINLNEEQIVQFQDLIEDLPDLVSQSAYGEEIARVVLMDANDVKHNYVESRISQPNGWAYYLKGDHHLSLTYQREENLNVLLNSMDAEQIPMDEPLIEPIPDDYFVMSLSGESISIKGPGNDFYSENYEMSKQAILRILFYMDEEFDNISEIKDTRSLLAGLSDAYVYFADLDNSYMLPVEEWNHTLIESNLMIELNDLENYAKQFLADVEFPFLEDQLLGIGYATSYYYDAKKNRILRSDKDHIFSGIPRGDVFLVPLRIDEEGYRIARVPVRVKYWNNSYGNPLELAQLILKDGTLSDIAYSDVQLFKLVREYQENLDVFDVLLNEDGKITSIHKVNQVDEEAFKSFHPLTSNQFILTKNGMNSIYTLQDTTQSAWLFNLCMEALCKQVDNFGYNVVSTLNENEDFIEIEVMLEGNRKSWLFDKQTGELLDDGLLNLRYFDGELSEIIAQSIKEKGYEVCPLAYEENKNISQCAVYPQIEDKTAMNWIIAHGSSFAINDDGKLILKVDTHSYGSLDDSLEIVLEISK